MKRSEVDLWEGDRGEGYAGVFPTLGEIERKLWRKSAVFDGDRDKER